MEALIHRIREFFQRLMNHQEISKKTHKSFQELVEFSDAQTTESAGKISTLSVGPDLSCKQLYKPEIPVSIGRFNQLSSLAVKGCNLSSLPWSIVYLKQLKHLDLSHNCFQYLPNMIGCLASLQTLNLEHNRLIVLPSALSQLTKLQVLRLDGNVTLQSPDYSVCIQGLTQILDSISKRNTYTNVWAGSRLCVEAPSSQSGHQEVATLFFLAANSITSSDVDFLSASFVPPRLKTFLVEEKNLEIKLAKCSACHGYFSNTAIFEGHICKIKNAR